MQLSKGEVGRRRRREALNNEVGMSQCVRAALPCPPCAAHPSVPVPAGVVVMEGDTRAASELKMQFRKSKLGTAQRNFLDLLTRI